MPIGHLGVNVYDLARAKTSYNALMPLLELEPFKASQVNLKARSRTSPAL